MGHGNHPPLLQERQPLRLKASLQALPVGSINNRQCRVAAIQLESPLVHYGHWDLAIIDGAVNELKCALLKRAACKLSMSGIFNLQSCPACGT